MDKPHSVRAALAAAIPALATNPESLLVFVEKGRISATAVPGHSFDYGYTLNVILTDYAGSPDVVFLALLQWMERNQIDVLLNPQRKSSAITFDAEMISNTAVDLSINMELTESVGVRPRPGGGFDIATTPEPDYGQGTTFPARMEIYANGELIAVIGDVDGG